MPEILKFDDPHDPPPYFYLRECDRGQGMRVYIKGYRERGDVMETEFCDDGVCGG